MYDTRKFRKLYINSERFRAGRIRHAKDYQSRHKEEYQQYQRTYRMRKRIEKALFGFVCEARMAKAVDVILAVIEREIELDRKNKEKSL